MHGNTKLNQYYLLLNQYKGDDAPQDERFWENIITAAEIWCFAYDPTSKRQSAELAGQNSPKPKKLISKIASEDDFNPLALELDIYSLAHRLCKM